MDLVLLCAAVGAVAGGTVVWRARARRDGDGKGAGERTPSPPEPATSQRGFPREDVRGARAGDILTVELDDHIVEEAVRCTSDGASWLLLRIHDGRHARHLLADDGEDGGTWLLDEVPLDIGDAPGEEAEAGGRLYRRIADGHAVRRASEDPRDGRRVRYARYENAGGGLLYVERMGSQTWAAAGRRVARSLVKVLPAS